MDTDVPATPPAPEPVLPPSLLLAHLDAERFAEAQRKARLHEEWARAEWRPRVGKSVWQ